MQQQLQNPASHTVANSFDVMDGPNTYATSRSRERNPKLYQALYEALQDATDRINADIRVAAQYWIEDGESKLSVDFVAAVAGGKQVRWTLVPERTMMVVQFMHSAGSIKVLPKSWQDFFFPEAHGLPGS